MRVIAIIPARSESKGIPNKNMKLVGGKPLINWSIEAAIESKVIDKIVVTSDGEDILEEAATFDRVTILRRPKELAQDNTPTEPVVIHTLNYLNIDHNSFDYLILLQPTSPLRTASDIDRAFHELMSSDANSLISVLEPEHHPLKCFKQNDSGYIEGLINNEHPFMPRQKLPKVLQSNGAIYIISIKAFLEAKSFFTNTTIPFVMPANKSIDVDAMEDIESIEKILKM